MDKPLSPKEKQIADLLRKGKIYREIAESSQVSINTIRNHIQSIYRKLNTNSKNDIRFEHAV